MGNSVDFLEKENIIKIRKVNVSDTLEIKGEENVQNVEVVVTTLNHITGIFNKLFLN